MIAISSFIAVVQNYRFIKRNLPTITTDIFTVLYKLFHHLQLAKSGLWPQLYSSFLKETFMIPLL